jgi:Tol biopolymer transport system component
MMKYLIPLIVLALITGCGLLGSDNEDETPSFAFESLSGTFVFAAHDSVSGRRQIYTMNHHGLELDEPVQITFDEHHKEYPAWSPDMEKIIYGSAEGGTSLGPAFWIMSPDGENREPLYIYQSGDDLPEGWFIVGRYPRWSPDMQQIAFGGGFQSSELYLFDIPSKQQIRTESGSSSRHFSWSPDGNKIAFQQRVSEGESSVPEDLFVIDSDGQNKQRLTEARTTIFRPIWTPDSDTLIFHAAVPQRGVYTIDVHSKIKEPLEANFSTDFQPIPIGLSADNQSIIVSVRDFSVQPPPRIYSLYVVDRETGYFVSLHFELNMNPSHIDWIETPVP